MTRFRMVTTKTRWILPAAVVFCTFSGLTLRRVTAEPPPPHLIATVDMSQIMGADSVEMKKLMDTVSSKDRVYGEILQGFPGGLPPRTRPDGTQEEPTAGAMYPVDAATLKAWISLREKLVMEDDEARQKAHPGETPAPAGSPAERTTLASYEQKAKDALETLIKLQNKGAALTADEKAQLEALQKLQQAAVETIKAKQSEYSLALRETDQKETQALAGRVQAVIARVAAEKNVSYVLNSSFVRPNDPRIGGGVSLQPTVLFPDKGVDLTDEVLKRLNSGK